MDISPIFFYLFAGVAIGFSLAVVFKRNPVASAFSLVVVFFAFAGIYALMNAHLIAALQILLYTGAVMVLFVFVIMLLKADVPSFDIRRTHASQKFLGGILCLVMIGLFAIAFKNTVSQAPQGMLTDEAVKEAGGNTRVIAQLMFSKYIYPFELTSGLILTAIVGAVALAKRKLGLPVGPDTGRKNQ